MTIDAPVAGKPRSHRGRRFYEGDTPSVLDQIPILPGGPGVKTTGAWAYYLRPDGATINEALILNPNGGIPDIDDARMRARFGTNAEYYRAKQAEKGFEYLGPTLTEAGVRRLVDVLSANRADEVLFCEDEIANCDHAMENSDRPEVRDQARRRKAQITRRLAILQQPFDANALVNDLKEIARAQQLASVDPAVLKVLKAMIGEVNETLAAAIARFQDGKGTGDGAPRMRRVSREGGFVDADP